MNNQNPLIPQGSVLEQKNKGRARVKIAVFFVLAITKGELTILYPLVSLGYLWTLLWARLFFNEPLTRFKFLGIGLILIGVFCLKLSSG